MNIFVLDTDPKHAAIYHCDKHVPKMIVETAQMMCTAHRIQDVNKTHSKRLYKATHINHPCTRWVRENTANYDWTVQLLGYLLIEYTKRFKKTHKTYNIYAKIFSPPNNMQKSYERTPFVQCMPNEYKLVDTTLAYRAYYIVEKARFAKWERGTEQPYWWPK